LHDDEVSRLQVAYSNLMSNEATTPLQRLLTLSEKLSSLSDSDLHEQLMELKAIETSQVCSVFNYLFSSFILCFVCSLLQ
jgi:hypothetical protein